MMISYIANARIPTEKAHGLQIMKMCEAFVLSGNDVELITSARRNLIQEDAFSYYDVRRIFKVIKIPCLDLFSLNFVPGVISYWTEIISFLLFLKIHSFFHRLSGIIYTRDIILGLILKNHVLELHALPHRYISFYRFCIRRAKKIIVLTSFLKNELVSLGIEEKKIIVAPDAVDLEKFNCSISKADARNSLKLPGGKYIIGYVGAFHTMGMDKGIKECIQIIKHLGQDSCLVLVGGDENECRRYQLIAQELGVADRVIFAGRVPNALVPVYLHAFDVALAPFPNNQHYAHYMSPLKIFEYMASGVPIVVSDLPSIREVLSGSNAILFEAGNVNDLVNSVQILKNDPSLGTRLSSQALKDVEKLTWNKRAETIMDFIRS